MDEAREGGKDHEPGPAESEEKSDSQVPKDLYPRFIRAQQLTRPAKYMPVETERGTRIVREGDWRGYPAFGGGGRRLWWSEQDFIQSYRQIRRDLYRRRGGERVALRAAGSPEGETGGIGESLRKPDESRGINPGSGNGHDGLAGQLARDAAATGTTESGKAGIGTSVLRRVWSVAQILWIWTRAYAVPVLCLVSVVVALLLGGLGIWELVNPGGGRFPVVNTAIPSGLIAAGVVFAPPVLVAFGVVQRRNPSWPSAFRWTVASLIGWVLVLSVTERLVADDGLADALVAALLRFTEPQQYQVDADEFTLRRDIGSWINLAGLIVGALAVLAVVRTVARDYWDRSVSMARRNDTLVIGLTDTGVEVIKDLLFDLAVRDRVNPGRIVAVELTGSEERVEAVRSLGVAVVKIDPGDLDTVFALGTRLGRLPLLRRWVARNVFLTSNTTINNLRIADGISAYLQRNGCLRKESISIGIYSADSALLDKLRNPGGPDADPPWRESPSFFSRIFTAMRRPFKVFVNRWTDIWTRSCRRFVEALDPLRRPLARYMDRWREYWIWENRVESLTRKVVESASDRVEASQNASDSVSTITVVKQLSQRSLHRAYAAVLRRLEPGDFSGEPKRWYFSAAEASAQALVSLLEWPEIGHRSSQTPRLDNSEWDELNVVLIGTGPLHDSFIRNLGVRLAIRWRIHHRTDVPTGVIPFRANVVWFPLAADPPGALIPEDLMELGCRGSRHLVLSIQSLVPDSLEPAHLFEALSVGFTARRISEADLIVVDGTPANHELARLLASRVVNKRCRIVAVTQGLTEWASDLRESESLLGHGVEPRFFSIDETRGVLRPGQYAIAEQDQLLRAIHEYWRWSGGGRDGWNVAHQEWDSPFLSPDPIASTYLSRRSLERLLGEVDVNGEGYRIVPRQPGQAALDDQEIRRVATLLAPLEHERWLREVVLKGYRPGSPSSDLKRTKEKLKYWDASSLASGEGEMRNEFVLKQADRDWNSNTQYGLLQLLPAVGLALERTTDS